MEGNSRFDFCPRCGAVLKDGICQSCGYQNINAMGSTGSGPHMYAVPQYQQMQYGAGAGYPPQRQAQYGAGAGYPPQGQAQYGAGAGYPPQRQAQYGAGAGYPPQGQMQYGSVAGYPQQYRSCAVVPPAKPKQKKAAVVIYFICLAIVLAGLVIVILAAVNDIENKDSQRGGKNSGTDTVQENTQEADNGGMRPVCGAARGETCLQIKIGTCKAVPFLL